MILNIQRGNFEEDINIIWPIRIVGAFYHQIETIDWRNLDAGIDWDEKVPDAIEQDMKKWFQKSQILDHIKYDRRVQENEKGIETNISIHSCSDALELEYGAAVYLAVEYQNGDTSSKLVVAKTKVAPLATVSIPRLELVATVSRLHLANTVAEIYKIDQINVNYWADSMNVFWEVRNHGRKLKFFLANRIRKIQRLSAPGKWNHVKTKENTAYLLSQGMSVEDLALSVLWWYGSENLKNSNEVLVKADIERSSGFYQGKVI